MTSRKSIKSAFESMMFTWGAPLEAKVAGEVLNITKEEAYSIFVELQQEYEQESRGIRIREVDNAFQFVTDADNADYVRKLCTPVKIKRLSQSALEVLAIVAYKQPVTKSEIEAVRGVRCDRVLEGLITKGLVEEKGKSYSIGRPNLYGTTEYFLRQFNLTSLKDLPDIEDIEAAVENYDDGPLAEQISIDFEAEK